MRDFLLALFIVFDVLAFLLYLIDKLCAKTGRRRVPEKYLLLLALPGGVGALLGMLTARHKIRKWYFVTLCTLTCIGQVVYVLQETFLASSGTA